MKESVDNVINNVAFLFRPRKLVFIVKTTFTLRLFAPFILL